ncbi:PREDICTED: uncharacterized protein LOC105557941 [Vollenhovia emeryi]|uniref:uncharacterized protein LOC105557941 n=1 Tax=Vollenhovia emeryi TaxID=411798 RepID=UPI0005F49029|nr:PREDICTED: uncharacterized protein LOC105557941 [Vollenhovia emeryi]
MKRSPLNNAAHDGRPYVAKHTPYNWKSRGNANSRGYERFSVSGAEPQPCDDNFISLNVSTPTTRHEKYHATNRYSPAGGRGSPGGGYYNNYRNNYHAMPRSNYNNRYSNYKHSSVQFHGQKRKSYRGTHRQMNVSAYIDINAFLEDPWEDLVKKLNDSKSTCRSEGPENESSSSSKWANIDVIEKSESKLPKHTSLDDSKCHQECEEEYSAETSFHMQNTDLSRTSEVNNLAESEFGDICSSQDLPNESTCSSNDTISEHTQENTTRPSVSLIDTDQKDI